MLPSQCRVTSTLSILIRVLLVALTSVPPAVCAAPCDGCPVELATKAGCGQRNVSTASPDVCCHHGDAVPASTDEPTSSEPTRSEPTSPEQSSSDPVRACGLTCLACLCSRLSSVESTALSD